MVTGEAKYRRWIVEYMDAWLARMKQNAGIIPSFVDVDGTIGGPERRWWGNAYGWGFSPINPVTGRRENRNRIPRALVGFSNALLVTGDREVRRRLARDDRRRQLARAGRRRTHASIRRCTAPTAGTAGSASRGASARSRCGTGRCAPADRARVGANPWLDFLEGKNAGYPEAALQRELESIPRKLATIRADRTPPDKRLADNMLDSNPAATDALVRLMWGALVPGREGGLLNARLRYFDPARRRAGVPEDVAALVSELGDRRTVVTLVNLSASEHAHGHRPGGRLRRAPVRIGRVERPEAPAGRPRLHRAARPGRRREAHARDAPLRQSADGLVSVEIDTDSTGSIKVQKVQRVQGFRGSSGSLNLSFEP